MAKETVLTIKTLKPGQRIRIFFNAGNINNTMYEFRGRVDDVMVLTNRRCSYLLRDVLYIHLLIQKGHAKILPIDPFKLDGEN